MQAKRDPFLTDKRAAERRGVGIRAQLREMGGGRLSVDVQDLSTTGFRVDSIYRIGVGMTVFLTIPSISPLEAVIVWTHKTGYGCRFAHPLHPAVFDMISSRYG